MDCQTDANHVGHRVQRPHLMKVDVPHLTAVGLGFGLGDGAVDRFGVGFHPVGQGQAVDDLPDAPRRGVVMVVVFMVMAMVLVAMVVAVLLLAVDRYPHVRASDAAGFSGHRGHLHPGQAQAVHRV